jgi:GNAT superfamily N-acetyltransferase
MDMLEIKENQLDIDTYMNLRKQVGWKMLSEKQAQMALDNCLFNVVAYLDGKPVGMGRIVGDGAVVCYVQDLVILPAVQGRGIGSKVLGRLVEYVDSITQEGTEMMLCLMCAKGREGFYKLHGFMARPTPNLGPGMIQYIRKMF